MVTLINPDDFVIVRKRKKYKFAKFANSPLCFELNEWKKVKADVVELGAGTALFLVELAIRHPSLQFVAIDVKADRLQKGAYEAEAQGLSNIMFLRARANQIGECFPAHSISQLWLTFPDPFPKQRSAGRRLTHERYLEQYRKILAQEGSIYLKHDSRPFFDWSLEQLVQNSWRIEELSFDLHESSLAADYKTQTSYERRWNEQGLPTNFVKAN